MTAILQALFGCRHKDRSRVWKDDDGQYQRCIDCGERLPYSQIEFGKKAEAA